MPTNYQRSETGAAESTCKMPKWIFLIEIEELYPHILYYFRFLMSDLLDLLSFLFYGIFFEMAFIRLVLKNRGYLSLGKKGWSGRSLVT